MPRTTPPAAPRRALPRAVGALVGTLTALGTAGAQPVPIDVRLRLTDLQHRPIVGAPVRVTFGSDPAWQRADAGRRLVTDSAGEARFTATAALERRWRGVSMGSLGPSIPRRVDYLRVAVELEYMTFRWLYVVDLHRLPRGDVFWNGVSLYTRDARGDFTVAARRAGHDWLIADLGGLLLTNPGHEPSNAMLAPDPAADPAHPRWTLDLAFRRSPEPVRR